MPATPRSDAYRTIGETLARYSAHVEAARTARTPATEIMELTAAVGLWGPLRRALSDRRAACVDEALRSGLSVRGLAEDSGVSRGLVQQMSRRHRLGDPLPAKTRRMEAERAERARLAAEAEDGRSPIPPEGAAPRKRRPTPTTAPRSRPRATTSG